MAYDRALADRIRELLPPDADLREVTMFGGLAFLVGGNMAVAASGQGGIMVRVDPATSDGRVATTGAQPMEMRGRPMKGWLRVATADVDTRSQLAAWVELGTSYARSLPPKQLASALPGQHGHALQSSMKWWASLGEGSHGHDMRRPTLLAVS